MSYSGQQSKNLSRKTFATVMPGMGRGLCFDWEGVEYQVKRGRFKEPGATL